MMRVNSRTGCWCLLQFLSGVKKSMHMYPLWVLAQGRKVGATVQLPLLVPLLACCYL